MSRLWRLAALVGLGLLLVHRRLPPALIPDTNDHATLQSAVLVYAVFHAVALVACSAFVYWRRRHYRADLAFYAKELAAFSPAAAGPLRRSDWFCYAAAVAAALVLMAWKIGEPILGTHFFRQAMIVSVVDKQLQNGLWTRPQLHVHVDYPFLIPIYEWGVSLLCLLLNAGALVGARLLNLLALAAGAGVYPRLLGRCGLDRRVVLPASLLFLFSPLLLYYVHAPIPDPLVVILSLFSLYGFARWQEAPDGKMGFDRHYGLMLSAGFLATLIKNPTYLGIPIAIGAQLASRFGWRRGLLRAPVIVFAAALASAVGAFSLVNALVGRGVAFRADTRSFYFGSLAERVRLASYHELYDQLVNFALSPLTAVAALAGVVLLARLRNQPNRWLCLGWLLGSFVGPLLFLNIFRQNYYKLPFVPVLALFAGIGLAAAYELLQRIVAAEQRKGAWVCLALVGLLALHVGRHTHAKFSWLNRDRTAMGRTAGAWLRQHTTPQDFVIYLGDTSDYDPSNLWFAQRDGVNLKASPDPATRAEIEQVATRFAPEWARVLAFCAVSAADCPNAEEAGWPLEAAGVPGALYRVR